MAAFDKARPEVVTYEVAAEPPFVAVRLGDHIVLFDTGSALQLANDIAQGVKAVQEKQMLGEAEIHVSDHPLESIWL